MSLPRTISGLTLLVSAWLFWGGFHAVDLVVSRGSNLSDALLSPPTSLIRLLATSMLILGAVMELFGRSMGRWIILIGTLLFCLMTVLMMASAESILWWDEAIYSGVLAALTAALLVTKRSQT